MRSFFAMASVLCLLAVGSVYGQGKLPSPAVGKVVADNNQFALELYAKLAAKDGNLFYSPYSISTALGMTYAGARGQTAEQMAKALRYTLAEDKLHAAFAALINQQNGVGAKRAYKLNVANRLWGQAGSAFRPDFLQLVQKNYGAGLQELDFIRASEPSRVTINDWIDKQTQGKIKDLIPQGAIDLDTRLVLTNAIYFKAAWMDEFFAGATKKADFWTTPTSKVQAMMMHRKADYSFVDGETAQLLELPYEQNDLSMLVILPRKKDGLKDLELKLTAANLDAWLKSKKLYEVDVKLPKFKFTSQFSLKQTLADMGMPIAFTRAADFSGMTSQEKLMISDVIHKAFVDVHEKGTEAAAATAVIMKTLSAPIRPIVPSANFHADHPFVFVIRDNRSGGILFAGRVANPV